MLRRTLLLLSIMVTSHTALAAEDPAPPPIKAMTPAMGHELFVVAFNDKNIEQLCALYADDAVVYNEDKPPLVGRKAICENFAELMETSDEITVETAFELKSKHHALLRSIWRVTGKSEDGSPLEIKGSGIEVMERQPDGSWLYVLDHPNGADEIVN